MRRGNVAKKNKFLFNLLNFFALRAHAIATCFPSAAPPTRKFCRPSWDGSLSRKSILTSAKFHAVIIMSKDTALIDWEKELTQKRDMISQSQCCICT